jgi:hypothetical protein
MFCELQLSMKKSPGASSWLTEPPVMVEACTWYGDGLANFPRSLEWLRRSLEEVNLTYVAKAPFCFYSVQLGPIYLEMLVMSWRPSRVTMVLIMHLPGSLTGSQHKDQQGLKRPPA